jgi:hypothetical protein
MAQILIYLIMSDPDIWLLQIDNNYHNIIQNSDGSFSLNTDYGFTQSSDKFSYYINQSDPELY